ncbi:MAG TPA: transporter substrate-binding domain-containing protein, partial [Candidatus Limnocylindria bacterium]|nr:transporter substrate-binding domain-containing protein [Candidatus Limnocylindria bacterium]
MTRSMLALQLVIGVLAGACSSGASAPSSVPSVAVSSVVARSELAAIRARGTLIVAIRMETPPAGRSLGDPAHQLKRALEAAVASLVARSLIGPNAKVEFRNAVGTATIASLDASDVDIAMTADTPAARTRALISKPYAAGAAVLAVKDGGPVRRIEDVAGKNVAVEVSAGDLATRDAAQTFFQGRGVAVTLDSYMGLSAAIAAVDAGQAVALVGDRDGLTVVAREKSLVLLAPVVARPYAIAVR